MFDAAFTRNSNASRARFTSSYVKFDVAVKHSSSVAPCLEVSPKTKPTRLIPALVWSRNSVNVRVLTIVSIEIISPEN